MSGDDDTVPKGGTGELDQRVEAALERVLTKQLAPVMEKVTSGQTASGTGGGECLIT